MTSLERLQSAGRPQPVSFEKAVDVLCDSTVAQRAGYAKDGHVIRGNVELAVLTAATLDLPLVRSLDYVYIVNNVPQLYASTQRILARREGYDLDFPDAEQTEDCGTAYIRYGERGAWRKVTFTAAQADKAGLLTKDNWKYRRDMLTARACTRAVGRYAPEVLAGMQAAGVWPDDHDEPAAQLGGRDIAPTGVTIPEPDREPPIDRLELEEIIEDLQALPADQREWFRRRWKDAPDDGGLGCPNLQRSHWLSAAHGALARYMIAEAQRAARFAEQLDGAVADAIPVDAHDHDDPPEPEPDPGRPFDE